jgi:hypothetical protein
VFQRLRAPPELELWRGLADSQASPRTAEELLETVTHAALKRD